MIRFTTNRGHICSKYLTVRGSVSFDLATTLFPGMCLTFCGHLIDPAKILCILNIFTMFQKKPNHSYNGAKLWLVPALAQFMRVMSEYVVAMIIAH